MIGVLQTADVILRDGQARKRLSTLQLAMIVAAFTAFYGSVMGTFSATSFSHLVQIAYSASKVPILLLATFAISLPSFFVFNTLVGLRNDFAEAIQALITAQAGLSIILAALAPFTGLWYLSFSDYNSAILFNAAMFGVASISAQVLLRRAYRPLIAKNPRHRLMLRMWLIIYVFVGIQMGWVLRPFVGSPISQPQFFRDGAFSNAYVVVTDLLWDVITRLFS